MLGKLFKHEWRSISRLLLPVHGGVLLFALLSRMYFIIGGGFDHLTMSGNTLVNTLTGILIFALCLVLFSACIFTYIYSGYRFYKNVFTDEGYLTNTLPVTPAQIILSKGLAAFLWLLIDIIVVAVSACILIADKEFFSVLFGSFFPEVWAMALKVPVFSILAALSLLLSPFILITMLYVSISVGSLFPSHKILGAIGTYIGIYVINQIFGFIELIIFGFNQWAETIPALPGNYPEYFQKCMNPIMICSNIFTILCILLCWFGTKYIMTKKLNLQ